MAWQEIDAGKWLLPGDRIRLEFKSIGLTWIKATQIALIERRLEGRADFTIKSVGTPVDQPTKLTFTIDVKGGQPPGGVLAVAPVIITAAAIGGVIVATGIVYKLTLEKSFLMVGETIQSPAGQVAIGGMGIGLAAAGIVALLALLPKK